MTSARQLSLGIGIEPPADPRRVREMVGEIVAAIDAERVRSHLSYPHLARRAGLAPSTLRAALRGTGNPQLTTVAALAAALGLHIELDGSATP
jgi:DNA-binding phage protein